MHGWNPLDWSAEAYLAFHSVAFVAALILGKILQAAMIPEGRPCRLNDEEQVAVLAGGRMQLAQTVGARLAAERRLTVEGVNAVSVLRPGGGSTEAQRALLSSGPRMSAARVVRAVSGAAQTIVARLPAMGLVMDEDDERRVRIVQTLPVFALLLLGIMRWRLGVLRGESVGILIVFDLVTLLAVLARFQALDTATRAGRAELASLRAREERLQRAPRETEFGMAVALFGPAALAGTTLDPFHRMYASSSGGCGGDSGGDGGDGGGGGCGGCGG